LDQKIREAQEKDEKYRLLKQGADRNEKILRKHMDENQALKRQLQAGGSSTRPGATSAASAGEAAPQKRDFQSRRAQRKE